MAGFQSKYFTPYDSRPTNSRFGRHPQPQFPLLSKGRLTKCAHPEVTLIKLSSWLMEFRWLSYTMPRSSGRDVCTYSPMTVPAGRLRGGVISIGANSALGSLTPSNTFVQRSSLSNIFAWDPSHIQTVTGPKYPLTEFARKP